MAHFSRSIQSFLSGSSLFRFPPSAVYFCVQRERTRIFRRSRTYPLICSRFISPRSHRDSAKAQTNRHTALQSHLRTFTSAHTHTEYSEFDYAGAAGVARAATPTHTLCTMISFLLPLQENRSLERVPRIRHTVFLLEDSHSSAAMPHKAQ